jgi:hypothetical protein
MKFPTEWKNTIHVPNHQPGLVDSGALAPFAPDLWKKHHQLEGDSSRRVQRFLKLRHI